MQKSKRSEVDDENGEEMMFMLNNSLRNVDLKSSKKPIVPSAPEEMLDPMTFNEGL